LRRIPVRRSASCNGPTGACRSTASNGCNADSEWRDDRPWTLARALLTYPFRPPAGAGACCSIGPTPVIRRWDELARQRRVVGLAAVDAHARVGVRSLGEPYDSTGSLHFPRIQTPSASSRSTCRTRALSGDANADARVVIDAIREGGVLFDD
jgi:hypothetical protein